MENGDQLFLRDAGPEDMRFLLDLRNEPESRRWSFHHEEISFAEHSAWYKRALLDESVRIFILVDAESDIGVARVNRMEDGAWRISYAICPEHRGNHYGQKMLSLLEEKVSGDVEVLYAEVAAGNLASLRTFASLQYVREDEADGWIVFRKRIGG